MAPLTNRLHRYVLPFVFLLSLSSCYQYKLYQYDSSTATLPKTQLVYSFFWGLRSAEIVTDDCDHAGYDRVVVKTNFVNSFVTVITLGIVSPMRVSWECAKHPPIRPLAEPGNTSN